MDEWPLGLLLRDVAHGRFPEPDGTVRVLPAVAAGEALVAAVLAFTAHTVIVADLPAAEIQAQLDPEDFGAPMSVPFLAWLAARSGGEPGVLDAVLVRFGAGTAGDAPLPPERGVTLVERPDLTSHPRAARALALRREVTIYADPDERGVVMLGRGVAGRREISYEVAPEHRGAGLGRALLAAALARVPPDEPVFAQASPGNAMSLRSILAAGFRPAGSELLFERRVRGSGFLPGGRSGPSH